MPLDTASAAVLLSMLLLTMALPHFATPTGGQ
jgi:hypothetical protein